MALQAIEAKYEILAKLDEGGMGIVYKVRHRLLDEIRVIKIIRRSLANDEALQGRFLDEARAAARLRHPNVAQLFDFSIAENDFAYMEIEFIDGIELGTMLRDSGPPELELGIDIARQSLRALAYLHRKGFVHRDISPDNLMLTRDVEGRPLLKLIDLGIAKDLHEDSGATERDLFLGKVRYASPEHFGGVDGNAEVEPRSDLYSLAVVLYEIFTGAYPIRGDTHAALVGGHLFQPPLDFASTDPTGRVPEALRDCLERALAKDPGDRFADALAFAKALEPADPRVVAAARVSAETETKAVAHAAEARRRAAQARREIEVLLAGGRLGEAEKTLASAEEELGAVEEFDSLREYLKELRDRVTHCLAKARERYSRGDVTGAAAELEQVRELDSEHAAIAPLAEQIEASLRRAQREATERRGRIEAALAAEDLAGARRELEAARGASPEADDFDDLARSLDAAEARARSAEAAAREAAAKARREEEARAREAEAKARKAEAEARRAEAAAERDPEWRRRWILVAALVLVAAVTVVLELGSRSNPLEVPAGEQTNLAEEVSRAIAEADLGEFYAIVVGNSTYAAGLPQLETAAGDAVALGDLLADRYGFDVELLIDATRYEILSTLETKASRLTASDNLLIFYAGHGYLDPATERSWWQPVDAEPDNTANWISSFAVSDILIDTPARRVLVVADSCFGGAFLPGGAETENGSAEASRRIDRRSRLAMTSGGMQPVVDNGATGHSIFAGVLLETLSDTHRATDLRRFFGSLRAEVEARAQRMGVDQNPVLLALDGDDGGLFPFVPKEPGAHRPRPEPAAPPRPPATR